MGFTIERRKQRVFPKNLYETSVIDKSSLGQQGDCQFIDDTKNNYSIAVENLKCSGHPISKDATALEKVQKRACVMLYSDKGTGVPDVLGAS